MYRTAGNNVISTTAVAPRQDANVSRLNTRLAEICKETEPTLINVPNAFVYRNRDTLRTITIMTEYISTYRYTIACENSKYHRTDCKETPCSTAN